MGARVRQPARTPPARLRLDICPQCGHETPVPNGAWLRWARERAGFDQRTLARQLAVSGPYLSDIERNRRACPPFIQAAYKALRWREEER